MHLILAGQRGHGGAICRWRAVQLQSLNHKKFNSKVDNKRHLLWRFGSANGCDSCRTPGGQGAQPGDRKASN
eukprot:6198491-Pleurochrysis_carterae.AAC.3